jgi:ABC-type antimicrobial peptide transport system permease subunit
VRETGPDKPAEISVFIPRSQVPDAVTDIANNVLPTAWVIRANSPSERIASAVKRAVLAIDAQQPISAYHAMDFVVSERIARQEFNLVLMSIFAAIAVLLAAIGIHGVVSYQVARRSRELGIRIALGATRADILRLVIRQAMIPVAVGVGAGMASALAVTRLIESMLFAVSARDPRTMAAIPLIVAAIALLGCIVPARRAAKIDPIIALRSE